MGEYVQPTATGGNGHLYRCTSTGTSGTGTSGPGTTGAREPTWPLTEGGTVADGGVVWTESTPVLANCVPPPPAPQITRDSGAGAFAAGLDVYVAFATQNGLGYTTLGAASSVTNTVSNDAVQATIPPITGYPGWVRNLASPYRPTGLGVYAAHRHHRLSRAFAGKLPAGDDSSLHHRQLSGYRTGLRGRAAGSQPGAGDSRVDSSTARSTVIRASARAAASPPGRDVCMWWPPSPYAVNQRRCPRRPESWWTRCWTTRSRFLSPPRSTTSPGSRSTRPTWPREARRRPPALTRWWEAFQVADTVTISSTAEGPPPSSTNTTGPVGNITADTPPGAARYASIAFTNRNGNLSGTVPAFTSLAVDTARGYSSCSHGQYPGTGPLPIVVSLDDWIFRWPDGTADVPFLLYSLGHGQRGHCDDGDEVIPDNFRRRPPSLTLPMSFSKGRRRPT